VCDDFTRHSFGVGHRLVSLLPVKGGNCQECVDSRACARSDKCSPTARAAFLGAITVSDQGVENSRSPDTARWLALN
jgi:hypothetical protein